MYGFVHKDIGKKKKEDFIRLCILGRSYNNDGLHPSYLIASRYLPLPLSVQTDFA